MPAMTPAEIWAALAENAQNPNGPVKVARAEYLVEAAEAADDAPLYAQSLLDVINAYEYCAEQSKLLVPFARLLRLWDRDPGAFDARRRHSLFWYFKWATGGMLRVPEVSLASITGWLTEMESRYRQAGHSPRPVHMGRHRLARATGQAAVAEREFEAWLDAPRDAMADCNACEAGDQGWWHAFNGRDEEALRLWEPVLGGQLVCAEEPHRVLAYSLLPLLRLGRTDEARANHLRGYRMARGVANLRSTIGMHLEFCALTGNEARGLEILTEHAGLLTPGAEDATSRLEFLIGAQVLLRRLSTLGLGDLALTNLEPGPATVSDTAARLQERIDELCARFDARNGSTTVSDGAKERLSAEPVLASLPLGSSGTLPARAAAAPSAAPPHPAPRPAAPSLDELVTEAERLSDARHPHARQAWERVAASGHELPPVIAARVERSRARTLLERDPAAARGALAAIAERLAQLGEAAEARETRANAAFAAFLAGDRETAEAEAVVIGAEAEAAYAAGDLTTRQYLSARSLPVFIAFNAFARLADPTVAAEEQDDAADPRPATELIESELEITEKLADPGRAAVYHRMLAQLAFRRDDRAEAAARLQASRDAALRAAQPWDAVEPADLLAQLALQQGDAAAAERHARDALAHGGDLLDRAAQARLYSLVTEALWRQPERRLQVVDAALRAGELWEGTSEPDSLHNRFIAARAYAGLKRHGEAAALFDELMPRVHVPYDAAGIAMTREQYADCLTQLGEHRRAAEQYLAAATLVQDDPHNRLPHARLAWSAAQALQSAGLTAEALPAYRRAADLWGEIGNLPARARCLRSAAWLIGWAKGDDKDEDADDAAPARWTEALSAMRSVLAELTGLPKEQRSEPITEEIGHTNDQLRQMLGCLREAEQQVAQKAQKAEAPESPRESGPPSSGE
ncbi:MAG TPA: hypothetical protein VFA06_25705 [Actinocrinis sp.]|uniref:hypothetical protein n=1 Tax=Actinocrinis sp. TaxID=1920516 RepID=UPI002D461BB2|nr:hypothetical protein [Actinocrinis sp.]HZU59301.1 hypothetical protein [Actinocrinis sp.]